MGLKEDIVVVNEYSVPLSSAQTNGKPRGSRGGSPGEYVMRYMARQEATETLAPISVNPGEDLFARFKVRESVAASADVSTPGQFRNRMWQAQGRGGVAFGYGEVSLAHEQLKAAAADVQRLFERGHTFMKTIVSFSHEYLQRYGLVTEGFELRRRGDYWGQVDQLKLRMALMRGVERMAGVYDDLRYVGAVQVDTENTHCHFAMVDAGTGNLAEDGTQKGRLSVHSRSLLRVGVDDFLRQKQYVRHLSSAVGYERRNAVTYVKRWAHRQMLREAMPQFLIACLPEKRRLWRLSTGRPEMRKPDRIVHEIVEEVLDRPGSPMAEAMKQVQAQADRRLRREGLALKQWQTLVERGREQLIEQGVSAVYETLRHLPRRALRVRTPMLEAMSMDYESLAERAHRSKDANNDMVSFGFRLRSYSTRLSHHVSRREQAHRRIREWEAAEAAGAASVASQDLHRFWQEEEAYQARVAAKYRAFLPFAPPRESWYQPWSRVEGHGHGIVALESMRFDQSLRKITDPDEAERIGREIYGQAGGHLVALGDPASLGRFDERLEAMRTEYERKMADLQVELAGQGLLLQVDHDGQGHPVPRVSAGPEYPFEEVKGLDLHHLRYDFADDVQIGERTRAAFVRWSQRRSHALNAAIGYLEGSGQAETLGELPVTDVRAMADLADEVGRGRARPMLTSRVAELAGVGQGQRRSPTVSLTQGLSEQISQRVREAVHTTDERAR